MPGRSQDRKLARSSTSKLTDSEAAGRIRAEPSLGGIFQRGRRLCQGLLRFGRACVSAEFRGADRRIPSHHPADYTIAAGSKKKTKSKKIPHP